MSDHVIHKFLFDIDNFRDKKQYNQLAGMISAMSKTVLQSRINNLLEKYHIEGYNIVIDELIIDLGNIKLKNFEYEILSRIERELRMKLASINIVATSAIKHGTGFHKNHKLVLKETRDLGNISLFNNSKERNSINPSNGLSSKHSLVREIDNNNSSTSFEIGSESKNPGYVNSPLIADLQLNENRYLEAIVFFLTNGWMPYFLYIPQEKFQEILKETLIRSQENLSLFIKKQSTQQQSLIQKRLNQLNMIGATNNKIAQVNLFSHPDTILLNKTQSEAKKTNSVSSINENLPHAKLLDLFQSSQIDELKPDNLNLLSRALVYYLSTGKKYPHLPYYVSDNKEIINQLYQRSPALLKEILELVPKIIPNESKRKERILFFVKDLSKKQIENMLKAYLSYSGKWKKTLNSLNLLYQQKLTKPPEWLQSTETSIISQTEFLHLILTNQISSDHDLQKHVDEIVTRIEKDASIEFIQLLKKEFSNIKVNNGFNIQDVYNIYFALSDQKIYDKEFSIIKTQDQKYTLEILKELKKVKKKKKSQENNFDLSPEELQKLTPEDLQKLLQNKSIDISKEDVRRINEINKISQEESNKVLISIAKKLEIVLDKKTYKTKFLKVLKEFSERLKFIGELSANTNKLRAFNITQNSMSIFKANIEKEIKQFTLSIETKNSPEETIDQTKNKFSKLLTEYYIPLDGNITSNLENIIEGLDNEFSQSEKSRILEKFDVKKVLNNPFLKNLSNKKFEKIVKILLPTDTFRSFIRYKDRYKSIWKKFLTDDNINIVFLTFLKKNKEINEKNIFVHFMKSTQELKGWNKEKLKSKSFEFFSEHHQKMSDDQKKYFNEFQRKIPAINETRTNEISKALSQGIAIKNAGLVLMWPFFKTLFQLAGLLDKKGNFIDKEAKERGIFLLQYIAVKQSSGEEPYLVLNKILVGFPLEDPISNEIVMTEKEKDICDALILNVIKQWSALGHSSADNLRGAFLIRDGILNLQGTNWHLDVEKKAFDLLLGKLPWSYSMIKISWLPYLIKVDWD